MLIKKKSIIVITLSSIIISLVLILTVIGFYLYLCLKERDASDQYLKSLSEINAKIYSKYIAVSPLVIKIDEEGIFEGEPIVEANINNQSEKKIKSFKLKLSIFDRDRKVLYLDTFYPIRPESYFGVVANDTGNYLAPGDTLSFKHILKNCPKEIESYLKIKSRFAKKKDAGDLEIGYECKIEEVIIE